MYNFKILHSNFLLFLLLGIVMLVSNYESNNSYSQRVFQTYENEKYGIKIQYPANWVSYEGLISETHELVVGFHPVEKDVPFVYLWVQFLSPENATLESFTNQSLKFIQGPVGGNQVIKILNQNSSVTLGGQPAHKVVYEETLSNAGGESRTLKHMSIWNVLETEGYRLTFSSDHKDQYDLYIKTAEKIINSFEFTR